jgi:hypothetical protein
MWWLGWRSEQTPFEERKMRRVPYVQLIILRLVVWAPEIAVSGVGRNWRTRIPPNVPVSALPVGVIPSAILISVLGY